MSVTSPNADGATVAAEPLELERVDACPLCGSTSTRTWRTNARDWMQPDAPDRFEYDRCLRCGAYFLSVRPRESELEKLYFASYEPYQMHSVRTAPAPPAGVVLRAASPLLHAAGAAIGLRDRRRLRRLLEGVYSPETPDEVLVDYGCGAPTFLDDARGRGFATVGVDFTDDVLATVRGHDHVAHLVADFERDVSDESVGCVRMNHVIEHVYRPRETLVSIRRKLRSGGRVHIATPNPGSIGSRIFGRRWHPPLDCPRHVVLYRPRVLERLLAQLDFRDITIAHEVGPKDLARSWGVVLYDRGRIAHDQIAAMATDRARFGALLPVASLGALAGLSDRYHVFARRV